MKLNSYDFFMDLSFCYETKQKNKDDPPFGIWFLFQKQSLSLEKLACQCKKMPVYFGKYTGIFLRKVF